MNTPTYYRRNEVGELRLADTQQAVLYGLATGHAPAASDTERVLLVNIDFQVDFVFENGGLAVPGAIEDVTRTIDWIYENMGRITTIAASLDSHLPDQIFYPLWWVDKSGNHPAPFTIITLNDVKLGRWNPVTSPEWSIRYLMALEEGGKKQLMIWPYHTMIGAAGQILVPALTEAIAAHSAARQVQPVYLAKGSVPETENYSIIEPEVPVPGNPAGGTNTDFLDLIESHDLIYIAGEAKSHCVLDTMHSIVNYFNAKPKVLSRIRFLTDCTSSVYHPDVDFDAMAEAELGKMEELGVKMVTSSDPIA